MSRSKELAKEAHQTHEEIQKWAKYVKEHPTTWKKEHTAFINAQFEKHEAFLKRLRAQPNGREKIIKLYGIKNIKGYEELLGKE